MNEAADRTDFAKLADAYAAGARVAEVLRGVHGAIDPRDPVWIEVLALEVVLARARTLDALPPDARAALPLFGVPFAVKDNIDVAGVPTTAGCPEFAYRPKRSATVVERLEHAGAVVVGKTNLDQFATGLVGTRSPYGTPRNPFDAHYIPGGSSSGSAVAVARGLVTFALGTDTAGSGRVPAGFTGTIGVKPTHGIVSTAGVVPACRSLDCVSIFARDIVDAKRILDAAAGPDPLDPFSRPRPPAEIHQGHDARWAPFVSEDAEGVAFSYSTASSASGTATSAATSTTFTQRFDSAGPQRTRRASGTARTAAVPIDARHASRFAFAVPLLEQRIFFGDIEAQACFDETLERLDALGGTRVDVDLAACFETAALLYDGPFVAERTAAVGDFIAAHPAAVLDVTRTIIESGRRFSAVDAFAALYKLRALRNRVSDIFARAPVLVVPTSPTIYRLDEIAADPYTLNARLGTYTNFVNLLDLCALAVPAGTYENGIPIGVTFIAPAFADGPLLQFARRFLAQ